MPRQPRAFEPQVSVHVIHRGNNRVTMFGDDADFELFLLFLKRATDRRGVGVHGFTLMTNHYHLVVTPGDARALPKAMQEMNGRYVQYFNRKYERIGTLFNGRYRALPIMDETYWLTCLRYVELNPVRARIVATPEDYRWSSYRAHAYGEAPLWLAPHPAFEALGQTPSRRQLNYRGLCQQSLTKGELTMQKFHADSPF